MTPLRDQASWDWLLRQQQCAEGTGEKPVHIRTADQTATLCGVQGGTISLGHYRENPSNHLSALTLCVKCDWIAGLYVWVADTVKAGD